MALSVPEKLKGKAFIRESPIAPAAAAISKDNDTPNKRYLPTSPAAQSPTREYGISMFRMPVMLIAFPMGWRDAAILQCAGASEHGKNPWRKRLERRTKRGSPAYNPGRRLRGMCCASARQCQYAGTPRPCRATARGPESAAGRAVGPVCPQCDSACLWTSFSAGAHPEVGIGGSARNRNSACVGKAENLATYHSPHKDHASVAGRRRHQRDCALART